MGVTPQLDNLDVTLTVAQNLLVFVYLYRLPRGERREAVERALAAAVAFFRAVDATRYLREAETVLSAPGAKRTPAAP